MPTIQHDSAQDKCTICAFCAFFSHLCMDEILLWATVGRSSPTHPPWRLCTQARATVLGLLVPGSTLTSLDLTLTRFDALFRGSHTKGHTPPPGSHVPRLGPLFSACWSQVRHPHTWIISLYPGLMHFWGVARPRAIAKRLDHMYPG